MVPILRDAGLSALLPAQASVEVLADGFQFTEGPLWCPDGSILVQDIKAEATYRLRPGHPAEAAFDRPLAPPTARRSSRGDASFSANRTAGESR